VPGGYALRVPERFVYIEPNAADDARRSTIPPATLAANETSASVGRQLAVYRVG
jgi:hypothetical protein